jgi:hypothetical protein
LDDLIQHLSFFEKKYNDWIKCKLPKSKFKWTGLQSLVQNSTD